MPNSILSRMDEGLCDSLGLKWPGQHRLTVKEHDPRSGSLEVAKRSGVHDKVLLDCWLKDFYEKENYLIEMHEDPDLMVRSKDGKRYKVRVVELSRSFLIKVDLLA